MLILYHEIAGRVCFRNKVITQKHVINVCRFDLCSWKQYTDNVIRDYTGIHSKSTLHDSMPDLIQQIERDNKNVNGFEIIGKLVHISKMKLSHVKKMIKVGQVWCKGIKISRDVLQHVGSSNQLDSSMQFDFVTNHDDRLIETDVINWHQESLSYKLQNPLKNEHFAKCQMQCFHQKMRSQDESWHQCNSCKEVFLQSHQKIFKNKKCSKCRNLELNDKILKYSVLNDAQPFNDNKLRMNEIKNGYKCEINEPPWYCRQLTDLEKRMIAPILPLATIVKLKKSEQYGIKDSFINVQQNYSPKKVLHLPRKIKDCNLSIIQCKNVNDLKQSESLKINGERIFLKFLKSNNNHR